MVDFDILKAYGSTNERLREICTAVAPEDWRKMNRDDRRKLRKDIETRKRWEERIRQRLSEGMLFSLSNYQLYSACDLAWDSSPINKITMPLILFAQGKINVQQCANQLNQSCGGTPGCADQYLQKDEKGTVTGIDLPMFVETNFNLVRSMVTRRLAPQANRYSNLWPLYQYEPRSTGTVAKLRADALSQTVDIMADQYGYRNHDVQVMRDMFMYGHGMDFVRCSWECEKQWERVETDPATTNPDAKPEVKTVVTKEGLGWVNPHPTRLLWDNAYPLSSINSDSGCQFIGFWEVVRYRDIHDNPQYFNQSSISFGPSLWQHYITFKAYFDQYLTSIVPPTAPTKWPADIAAMNDRSAMVGVYSPNMLDASVFRANYFEKINPKAEGVGDYPFDVWVRYVTASDSTIIYAEFMPSTPGAYCGFNENDNRMVNISFAHEIMPYQDQMSNLITGMLMMCEAEMLKIVALNTDALQGVGENSGEETNRRISEIRKRFKAQSYSKEPIIIEYSAARAAELGLNAKDVVTINEARVGQTITEMFNAMTQLVAMVEKLTAMSPAEQGQPAPREISATEVSEIATTTSAVYDFISNGIDEFRAAKKRIIYESLVCCRESEIRVPVINRYSEAIIRKAGFEPVADEVESVSGDIKRHTIIGSKRKLVHDFIFTSRDGAERPVNTQAANTLVQLLGFLAQYPVAVQAMGKEKLFGIINEIFRMSGAGLDLNLELKEGDDNSLGQDELEQLKEITQELANAVQKNSLDIQKQTDINTTQQQMLAETNNMAQLLKKNASDIQRLFGQIESISESEDPKKMIRYDAAPRSIQAQMEAEAGYVPAPESEPTPAQEKLEVDLVKKSRNGSQ